MAGAGAIVVFAKAPRAGLVKTRMSPPLSTDEAVAFYANLLDDVLDATGRIAAELDLQAVVAVYPGDACHEICARAPRGFRVVAQRGRDLAERMSWAVAEIAAGGVAPVLLRGSDSPVLDVVRVREAVDILADCDLVLCPDLDGGYNLVGLRTPAPGLFAHPMSTSSVLEDTLYAAERLGLSARVLEPSFDIDTAGDLLWLERARSEGRVGLCPRTIAYLDENDLWRHASAHIESAG